VTDFGEPRALVVYAVNYPLQFFAERIGGEQVMVRFPAPPDEDPAYWAPDADTIAGYQSADLILLNGAGYARWVDRAALPASKIVDTSAGFADRHIPLHDSLSHSHGPEGEHEHAGWAFTTWLDPTLAVEQARAVADSLIALRPEHETEFRESFEKLEGSLLTLDARYAAAAGAIGDTPLVFSHPVFQYLERRYGLNGRSLHWEPQEAPHLDDIESMKEGHPARWVIWEAEPMADSVQTLEAHGYSSVVFDPCGNVPENGDLLSVMAANAAALETIADQASATRSAK
jgi:zinc transport system substrate-binding protein